MSQPSQNNAVSHGLYVAAGQDRFDEHRGLGISTIGFKVCAQDNPGLFVVENTFYARGGPARHLHYDQDEWAFVGDATGRIIIAFTPPGKMEAFFRVFDAAGQHMPGQEPPAPSL